MASNPGSTSPQWWHDMISKKMNAEGNPTIFECPKCDSKEFQDTARSPLVLFQVKDKEIDFKTGIFVHAAACRKCGFMELRSLTAMDIDPTK